MEDAKPMVSVNPPASDSLWRQIFGILREVGKRNPWPLMILVVVTVVGNARTALFVLALGGITQALIDQSRSNAIMWAAIFIAAGLIEQIYWPLKNHLRSMVEDDAAVLLQTRVLRRAADSPLELFEHAPFFNTLTRANDDLGRRATLVLAQALDVLQVLVLFGGLMAPLFLIDTRIVWLVILGCLPVFLMTWKTATAFHHTKTINAPSELYAMRLSDLMLNRESAAELRLFGTGPILATRWLAARFKIADDSKMAVGRISMSQFTGEIFASVGLGSAILLLVHNMLGGQAELGSLVAVVFAISWAVSMVGSLAEALRLVRENGAFLGDIFEFERISSSFQRPESVSTSPAQAAMRVTLENVSFRFPESNLDVVKDVNLDILPGEHIALLGENGAGKSTLVRLISGLYAPTEGEILHDDAPLNSKLADIGAVFQDFVRWQLPLRDNIGFGNISRVGEDEALVAALEKADIAGLVDELGNGLDTWLGRQFGDRDLSGGQWQRIAIARAFFRDARLLILDEPTAALDPLAEQRLFERFHELADGKTTITISHRIGTARMASKIVLMNNGNIVEIGTHDSLLSKDGAYAAMYRAQAEWYHDETGDTLK